MGLTLAASVGSASAQSTPRPKRTRDPFQLTHYDGYLEFEAREREHNQTSKVGTGETRSKERILEESIRLQVDGFAYHPNLLEFTLGGLFGMRQFAFEDSFGGRERSSRESGPVTEFDLEGSFFKKKDYPGRVFARRYRALEARPFLSSLENTTTNYGLVWQYIHDKMPTNIQLNRTEVDLQPLTDDEEPGHQENSNVRFETAYNISDHNAFSLLYNRQSVTEEPFALAYDSDELTLGHRWNFGRNHRHVLESEFNGFDQRGTFNIERFRWRETLRLMHTETLRSWYRFEAIDRTQGGLLGIPAIEEESYLLTGTVEHQLYESLASQLTAFAQRQEFALGPQIDRAGVLGSLSYRKSNPWGTLSASYRPRYQSEDRKGLERSFEIFRARQTFRDPEPLTLNNLNIDTSSIRITAEDQITVYHVGRDYRLRQFEDRVEVWRVATGRILDGQTVLVDYVYSSGDSFTLDTVGQNLQVRQDFDFGLSPYYRLRWQDQTVSPETTTGIRPDDITAQIVGAEFERWKLRLTAEIEDHESTINPFEAIRLGAGYRRQVTQTATAVVKARWSDVTHSLPEERETTFFTLEGRYRQAITSRLSFESSARYRHLDDTIGGTDEGIDVDLALEWKLRETEIRVSYQFGQFEDDFAENDHSVFYLQVRRHF